MRIGDIAKLSGASVRSIRHYESVGLLRPARTENGYRIFHDDVVPLVRRIRRMIALGFSTHEIAAVLPSIVGERSLDSACVVVTAAHQAKLEEIESKIADLERRKGELLATLQSACRSPSLVTEERASGSRPRKHVARSA